MKTCTKCGTDKELQEFPFRSRQAKTLFMWCRECVRVTNQAYYQANKESVKAKVREGCWGKKNPGKKNANTAKRRATKANATPSWADLKTIQSYYEMARLLEYFTFGQKYHVDHVIPLQHDLVCGLHTVDNITIRRAEDNLSKGNKFSPI